MNLESGAIAAIVVIASLLLGGLVVTCPFRIVLCVAGGFCALAAVADFAELVRQVDRSKTGLAVVAGAVAVTHVVGGIAGFVATRQRV